MEELERELLAYRIYTMIIGRESTQMETGAGGFALPDLITSANLLGFLQRLTKNDQISLRDVGPIFTRLDTAATGMMDWENFGKSFYKLLENLAPDISFLLINESAFDDWKEELLGLFFSNCLLSEYVLSCEVSDQLTARIPIPSVLRRESDIMKTLEPEEPDLGALVRDAVFYLGDTQLLSAAVNSRDNLQGLRRLTRSFSVLNHVEHPKDFIAVSGLLGESMEAFMKEGLLHQTFRLLEITTDENCLFEVWKIIYYLFNMLKFKNEKFDFRKVLLRQNCNELLLSKDTLSGLCLLALGTPNSNVLTLVLILVNLVKYTDDLFLETLNPGLLERLLSHLGNAPGPQLSSALSLLAYSLCLKREAIASSEMVEVLLRASTVMMETPGQVEVFIYGIRIYSRLMNSTSQDVYYFNVINKVRGLLNPKENNVLQIECLKMLRSACTVDKYIPSVAHEKQLMDFIYSKVFQGDSSLSRVCSQIVCNISLSSYKQSLDCLQILKNLEAKKYSMNLMDMLICLKSLISEERILDLLLSNNLVGALVDCASHYRIDKHVLLTEAYVPETAFVCLCFDILFIVMNRSKDHRENQATWSQGSVKDQRLALAKLDSLSLVLEYVCLDKKVFCRSLSNALILKICNNSLLVNVSGVLGILKSVYTSLRMFDHVGTVDTIDAKLREVFNEHYESIEKSDRKYTITFKVYSIFDFPNGDNRIFTIEGIHSFKDLFDHIYDRYKYLGDIMISFKDTYDNNMITLDSDQVYDKLLYQVFRDDNNLHKKADISLFVRSTSQRFDQSNNPFVASRDNQREVRCNICQRYFMKRGPINYNDVIRCESCLFNPTSSRLF